MGKHLAPPSGPALKAIAIRRVLMTIGLVLIGVSAMAAGYAAFRHETIMQLVTAPFVPQPDQLFGKPNLLVLIEGLDYDYTDNDQEFSTNSRSDVIWAVNLDFTNKSVYQLSVPRDMVATLPNGTQAKINQAQSDGGVKEAKQVIAQFLEIPQFDRYMVLRIDAAKDFVNAIGGVDLYVKNSDCLKYKRDCTGDTIDYDDSWGHLHIHLKEGMQHLDGEHAVAYMRFRHDWCSDPCRIMRQQQALQAAMDKLKGDKMNTLLHADNLLSVFRKDVETDFTDGELVSLASYFGDFDRHNLHQDQVPYVGDVDLPDYGDSLVPDKAARAKLVQAMLVAPPAPMPSPDAMALASIAPATIRVDVQNGTVVSGAARRVADVLRARGFVIGTVGDADTSDHASTEIREHSHVTFAGAKVRDALPKAAAAATILSDGSVSDASPDPATAAPSDVTVIVGKDLASQHATVTLAPLVETTP